MARKILALVSEPISGEVLKNAVGADEAEAAEVLVVAPALNDKLRFWASDPDGAIERASDVAQESAERMEEQGVDTAGHTGDSDPLQAIQDALQTFHADEIVLATHESGERNWLEEGLVDEVKQRFPDRPVRHVTIT